VLPLGRLVVVSTLLATAVACGRDRPPPDAQATSVAPEIVPTTATPPTTAPWPST